MHRSAVLLVLALAACTPLREPEPTDLADACQLQKCRCASEEATLFSRPPPAEVRWQPDGRAYCPAGYRLEPIRKERTYYSN